MSKPKRWVTVGNRELFEPIIISLVLTRILNSPGRGGDVRRIDNRCTTCTSAIFEHMKFSMPQVRTPLVLF